MITPTQFITNVIRQELDPWFRWIIFTVSGNSASFPGHSWIVVNFSVDEPEVPLCYRTRARVHVSLLCQTELIHPLKPGKCRQLRLLSDVIQKSHISLKFYIYWIESIERIKIFLGILRRIHFTGQSEVQNCVSVLRQPGRLGSGLGTKVSRVG